jgi:hypothetical protein
MILVSYDYPEEIQHVALFIYFCVNEARFLHAHVNLCIEFPNGLMFYLDEVVITRPIYVSDYFFININYIWRGKNIYGLACEHKYFLCTVKSVRTGLTLLAHHACVQKLKF